MGQPSPTSPDRAVAALAGTFTGSGASPSVQVSNRFNVTVYGTFVATLQLERSFDGGTTWNKVSSYNRTVSYVENEPESGVLYRMNCTSFTSGSISYRISQ